MNSFEDFGPIKAKTYIYLQITYILALGPENDTQEGLIQLAFPQLLWERTFLQSLWEQYTMINLALSKLELKGSGCESRVHENWPRRISFEIKNITLLLN